MRFVVEFTGKLPSGQTQPVALAVDVPDDTPDDRRRELAWDEFKRKTGLRRWAGDTPPKVEPKEAEAEVAADDSSRTGEPGDGTVKPRGKARRG